MQNKEEVIKAVAKKDVNLILTALEESSGTRIEEDALLEELDGLIENGQLQSQFDLDNLQTERVQKAKGSYRIGALAAAIRTQHFMHSYK